MAGSAPFRAVFVALAIALGVPAAVAAQEAAVHRPAPASAVAPRPPLPAPAVTHHVLDLPGRTLHFTATARAIALRDQNDTPLAEIATIAYTLDGADPASRPVVFVFNGGPGYASAFLQLGGLGPWRVPMDAAPSSEPLPVPNAETWLDFADLVFIDPVDTGYSRFDTTDADARKRMLSVNGDTEYLAEVIRRWLVLSNRPLSPKFIAGESYGGFRAPRIARTLQSVQGVGVNGLVLISPMLDSGGRSSAFDPLYWAELLPTLAAVHRSSARDVSRAQLADVEAYATGEYLQDQLRVAHDPVALDRVTAKVAALTGLDPALVRRLRGRVNVSTFLREREPGRIGSPYDATLTDPRAEDANPWFNEPDPETEHLNAPLTSGMLEVYHWLNWQPEQPYHLRNPMVARNWDWERGLRAPEAVTALRDDLAVDDRMRVLVVHGLYDLVTPYFASALILDNIPAIGQAGRIRLLCFPGGHMVYAGDSSRRALRDAARDLITETQDSEAVTR